MGQPATRGTWSAGKRQKHRAPQYDPASGKPYRTMASMEPEVAVDVMEWSEQSGRSIAWILNQAAKNAPKDPATGLPIFLMDDAARTTAGQLPLDDMQEAS